MKTRISTADNLGSRTLGIIGGLGSLAGGDLFFKLTKSEAVMAEQGKYRFLCEQHPFRDVLLRLDKEASINARKFYVFQISQSFVSNGVDGILLPCFASHTFRDEVQAEIPIPIFDMMRAMREQVERSVGAGVKLGVLTSDYVRFSGIFEKYFGRDYELVYPSNEAQARMMEAMYGVNGIKDGHFEGLPFEEIQSACEELQHQGVQLIVPGMTELSLICAGLQRRGIEILDANEVYASFATADESEAPATAFKLGIVGGVGPAATVDFMAKVVKNTPAGKDQDHIKMVVEQNPQIPDRTANLLFKDTDPTMAMYATCKRLEHAGANAIAIPCNTAHAFVERIQPHLRIPIVNMLTETVESIVNQYGAGKRVGLLATSGTIESHVYHKAAGALGLELITPAPEYQQLVMDAIYGEKGIKAGFTEGLCKEQLLMAAEHLCELGASALILGCTELPLLLEHADDFVINGRHTALIDPTTVLAKRCVQLALD